MKLNIKKNMFIGLKGILVSIVAGLIIGIAHAIVSAVGITSMAVTLFIALPVSIYIWGMLANKWFKWV